MNSRPAIIGGAPIMGDQEVGIVRPSIADYTTPELMSRIQDVLLSNQVTNGVNVRRLEEEMAEYLGGLATRPTSANTPSFLSRLVSATVYLSADTVCSPTTKGPFEMWRMTSSDPL